MKEALRLEVGVKAVDDQTLEVQLKSLTPYPEPYYNGYVLPDG